MIRLEDSKLTKKKPIQQGPVPQRVSVPLIQHLGRICKPELDVGDVVLRGQRIATLEAGIFSPIYSSISGKVVAIEDAPHPVLGQAKAIVIESDGQDRAIQEPVFKIQDPGRLTAQEIRKKVFEAGIVGLGGAAFPAHIKLNPPRPVDTFILNGAECEPYLTSDYRLMVEKTKEILLGVDLVVKCLGVKKTYIAIEDNKPEAIKAFRKEKELDTLHILKSMYPQGGEKQLIKNILNREVPRGKLPFDVGVVVNNVATAFAIYEAVYKNKPLYERVVTVTGDCLSNPGNFWVRIGTPIKDLIDRCLPFKKDPVKIIIGGPMMGIAQYTTDVPVIKSTNGIVLFSRELAEEFKEDVCIRCGRCIAACPMGLMPCLISLAYEKKDYSLARLYGAIDCIECGACAYACVANRRIVQAVKHIKLALSKKETNP
jgi:electron transport complex protein RnfC